MESEYAEDVQQFARDQTDEVLRSIGFVPDHLSLDSKSCVSNLIRNSILSSSNQSQLRLDRNQIISNCFNTRSVSLRVSRDGEGNANVESLGFTSQGRGNVGILSANVDSRGDNS